jgi:L-rhamnose-H+ transport protein
MGLTAASPLAAGLALVLAAGFFQGGFMAPSKWIRGWAWENYWLLFAITAYLICPWALALATIPRLFEIYAASPGPALAAAFVFGAGWGIGAVTFGLGVEALGLALGFAVILGVAATCGAVIPLFFTAVTGAQAAVTALALAFLLAGVAVCSFAGRWKETGTGIRSYRRGLAVCIASGVLSSCGNLGFAFGGAITARAQMYGVPEAVAPNVLWTLLTFPLFLSNAGYALYLLRARRTVAKYGARTAANAALAVSMGVMWMAGIALYGAGARKLGPLGTSLGWGILMSSMVLVANVFGIAAGEWSEAPRPAKRRLAAGVLLLLLAIGGLASANAAR